VTAHQASVLDHLDTQRLMTLSKLAEHLTYPRFISHATGAVFATKVGRVQTEGNQLLRDDDRAGKKEWKYRASAEAYLHPWLRRSSS